MELKFELRKQFKQKRDSFFVSQDAQALQAKVLKNLNSLLAGSSSTGSCWASYNSIQSEVDVSNIEETNEISWCFPVLSGEALDFYKPQGQWVENCFQIQEPNPQTSQKINLGDIEGILVPGLAFDLSGHRLGWGKAYYDHTLKDFSGIKVGMAYSVQITSSLPIGDHDIPMDFIVTEKEVLKIKERKVS
jgi:5-formyltetrahydrofolate cyclo-ligase